MNNSKFVVVIFVIIMAFFVGCSGSSDPLTPARPSDKSNSLPIIAFSSNDDVFNAIGLFGSYELSVSPDSQTVELISKRTSTIGESFIVNGINFFVMTPCSDCLEIKSISLTDDELLMLTFDIRHPFEPGDPFKPPSGRNRLDLNIFDTALLFHPLNLDASNYPLFSVNAYTDFIVNASGYTRELEYVIADNAALPYVLVVDDNADNLNTFNKFAMGDSGEFDVLFNIDEQVNLDIYLTMGYGASATFQERLNPTYYNPEFNRKAAWKVMVTPAHGDDPPDYSNTWNEVDSDTSFDISVAVFDWQIGANVDPNLTNETDVFAASEVASVSLEIPGMHDSLNILTTPESGTGMPGDPLIYTFSIANENLLENGEYTGLVKVTDTRTPGSVIIGGETDTLADSIDGIDLQWLNIFEFATYQTFSADVLPIDPFVIFEPNGSEVWRIGSMQSIIWSGGSLIENVRIEYSKDDFDLDINLIEESVENTGEHLWEIPDDESETAKVRISAVDFPWIKAVSDDYFTIEAGIELLETIVFAADGPAAGRQIYTIDPEGTESPRQWTNSSAMFNEGAKLSPCGGYIIYTAASMEFSHLRIIDVTTGIEKNINPEGLECIYGDFSHDGTRIVSACNPPPWFEPNDLYTFDYNGENVERLTTNANVWAPSYSKDDSKIVYQNFADMQVYIYDFDTGESTRFTNNTTWNDNPVFSPDGTQIAWATMYGLSTGRHIWVSPLESWNPPDYRIDFGQYIRSPCFSPDGTRIVFDHGAFNESELAIYDIDEGTWHNITNNAWGDYQAHWGFMLPID